MKMKIKTVRYTVWSMYYVALPWVVQQGSCFKIRKINHHLPVWYGGVGVILVWWCCDGGLMLV